VIVIGLTGGIAAGKSTISQELERRGATVIDADKVGHEAYTPGTEGWQAVRDAFGEGVVAADGTIDRRALGAIIFGDPKQRDRLQALIWPVMKRMMANRLAALRADGTKVAVVEAAVLLEAGWQDLTDKVWVVTIPPDVAVQRLAERNNMPAEQARERLAAQLSNEERTRNADAVIDNARPLTETITQVGQLWDALEA
jgi:dephospho-CoA kinase